MRRVFLIAFIICSCSYLFSCTDNKSSSKEVVSKPDAVELNMIDSTQLEPLTEEEEAEYAELSLQGAIDDDPLDVCERCNIKSVVNAKTNIKQLDEHAIHNFLCGFGIECVNNAEYSAYSNEVFFMVLKGYPDLVINEVSVEADLDVNSIIAALSTPVHDGIDLEAVYSSVERVTADQRGKEKILKALTIAIKRNE